MKLCMHKIPRECVPARCQYERLRGKDTIRNPHKSQRALIRFFRELAISQFVSPTVDRDVSLFDTDVSNNRTHDFRTIFWRKTDEWDVDIHTLASRASICDRLAHSYFLSRHNADCHSSSKTAVGDWRVFLGYCICSRAWELFQFHRQQERKRSRIWWDYSFRMCSSINGHRKFQSRQVDRIQIRSIFRNPFSMSFTRIESRKDGPNKTHIIIRIVNVNNCMLPFQRFRRRNERRSRQRCILSDTNYKL
jgi:hypothetical protein